MPDDRISCTADVVAVPLSVKLADSDVAIAEDQRIALIERITAGGHVELDITAQTYAQGGTAHNRNGTRFSPAALNQFAKLSTKRRSPFVRNHSLAVEDVGGFTLASNVERGDGRQLIEQMRLVTPWATLAALNGTMSRFSIHWRPDKLEDVHCSACNAPVIQCGHWPGDEVKNALVEYVYKSADPVERSWVVRPAIEQTGIQDLAQALHDEYERRPRHFTTGAIRMKPNTLASLALGENATDEEIHAAVVTLAAQATEVPRLREQLAEAEAKNKALESARAEAEAKALAVEVDAFVAELKASGKVRDGDTREALVRANFANRTLIDSIVATWEAPAALKGRQSKPDQEVGKNGGNQSQVRALDAFRLLPERTRQSLVGNNKCTEERARAIFATSPNLVPDGITLAEVN